MALGMPVGGGFGNTRNLATKPNYGNTPTLDPFPGQKPANPYQTALDFYTNAYGPDRVGAQNAANRARATLPFTGAYYDAQRGFAQGSYDIGMRGIGLDERSLGIDRVANARDRDYYQNLLNILGQQKEITGLDFLNTQQQLLDRRATDERRINDAATAGGSWLGPGRAADLSDVEKNFNTALQAAELQRRNTLLSQGKEELGLTKSRDETKDRDAKLDIMAEQLGLNREKLKLTLDQGLANLGYQQYLSTNDLLDKIDSANAQEAAIARQILESVIQSGQAFASGAVGDYYSRFGG